ncbi:MAG: DUF429 domain-containing protein [Deltaproteobacteria bacterium]|nr:DUF429 domain-containing protein [Deltaproteobacteria bacterium]
METGPGPEEGRWVAGVDGCPAGWFVVFKEITQGRLGHGCLADLADILDWPVELEIIGLDMPLGLLDQAQPGGRDCDRAARRLLGKPRSSSVFSPPVRAALSCPDYAQAQAVNCQSSIHRVGLSIESFNLFKKLREVDRLMTAQRQEVIKEVHPELSFMAMNQGRAVLVSKKNSQGRAQRQQLLANHGLDIFHQVRPIYRPKDVASDDILDAAAACFSAQRIALGQAVRLPQGWPQPPQDAKGLCLEMWY